MRRQAPPLPDLFGAAAAPAQVRVPARSPVVCAPPPVSDPLAVQLAACLAAHQVLDFVHRTARELEERMRRAPVSPNEHAANRANHAAVLLGGAVMALADALLLNGGTAHDSFPPTEED